MAKTLQPKKIRIKNRFKAIVAANFMGYKDLYRTIQAEASADLKYDTFMKVIYGDLISGPKAELIMQTTAKLTGRKVETLWPEIKYSAA